jgi:VanZ like family
VPSSAPLPARPERCPAGTRTAWVLIGGYLVVLAALTVPRALEARLLALADHGVARLTGRHAGEALRWVEPALNVALFVPLAFLLCWGLPRLSRLMVWTTCLLGSVGVEATQYLFLPGRHGSVRDVLTNATGAAIGVALHRLVTHLRRGDGQPARQQ